ncbi:Oidioi.mRNA.OKI2018_I69.chr2.g6717.t1.cds [Oikopleura dioica]|uniref:Oidioi.mRNA.OKI2018_I69.chr2.g6717.t1.cds n=1 Tax=Oikopleura dioica TaxID=34765 RepID=A0ABN7T4V2_OIKDI|nr:Oidioi.mRNA.OKI2018_I69.chr2.g6717.t1.cds [Oikopleura dioica]
MSDSEDQQQSSASFDQPSDPADAAETPKKVENGTSVIVEQPRLQTQTSVLDEGDDIDVECSSVANAADALKAQQEVLRDEDAKKNRPERPKSVESMNSISSTNSIPPLPPLPNSTSTRIPQKSPVNNFTPEGKTNFSASFLSKPEHPKKPLLKRTLCKSYSDGIFHNAATSVQQQDKDSQLIGVTNEHPIGPLCVIRRNVQFDSDDAFIKSFRLYWYVDAEKGCLESPILSNRRLHGQSIETPYFVITKNQRRHQAYSCTFCKGKTTFTTILQAIRHLKANHRHNVKILVQDPKGVFQNSPPTAPSIPPMVAPVQMPWSLAQRTFPLMPSVPSMLPVSVAQTIPSSLPQYIPQLSNAVRRSATIDIPSPEALENTKLLTNENIIYLKGILSSKLNKKVVAIERRGGCSVSVSFEDGKSRIVRLANESSSTTSPSPSALEKQKVLRTVSATTTAPPRSGLYGALDPGSALKIPPASKSKYAAKTFYINKKNEIDTANTNLYKSWGSSVLSKSPSEMSPEESQSTEYTSNEQVSSLDPSESPKTAENDSRREPQQALHGNSILTEEEDSPTFKVCDNKGKISEQQTFKMRLEKPKANSSNGMSFENGAYKMDNLGQYFNTFIKVQVLALNHQCKICSHATETELEMADHIQEHSLKELNSFAKTL